MTDSLRQRKLTSVSLSLIFLSHLSLGCQKDDDPWWHDEFWSCHTAKSWTMQEVQDSLIGTWEIQEVQCPRSLREGYLPIGTIEIEKIVLEADQQGLILREGIETEVQWSLRARNDSPLYILRLSGSRAITSHFVLICDNQLELNYSYRWGCNTFYQRT